MINAKKLWSELDKLNFRQRWERLVELTRTEPPEAIEKLQNQWGSGELYQRYYSLKISIITQDQPRILEALKSSSRMIRGTASAAALKFCLDHPDFEQVVADTPASLLGKLLTGVGRTGPSDLADRLVKRFESGGPRMVAKLLPACSRDVVEKHINQCEVFVSGWWRLARNHPDLLARFIEKKFESSPRYARRQLWSRFEKAIELIAEDRPEFMVDLVRGYAEIPIDLTFGLLRLLMRLYLSDSDSVGAILLQPKWKMYFLESGISSPLLNHIDRLNDNHMLQVAQLLLPKSERLCQVFLHIAPSRRRTIMESLEAQTELHSDWSQRFLMSLPYDLRQRYAAESIKQRSSKIHPWQRAELATLMSFDDAVPELEPLYRSATADNRGMGYRNIVLCAGINRCLGRALEVLQRTKNEQDPVRASYFHELTEVPLSSFGDSHAEILEALIQAALEARDTSHATFGSIQMLLQKFLAHFGDDRNPTLLALTMKFLKNIANRSGGLYLNFNPSMLPKGREFQITELLAPLIKSFNKQERFGTTLQLAAALGRRGWKVPLMQELLKETLTGHEKYVRQRAISLWLADPETRDQRVVELLKSDPSTIVAPDVFYHLHRRRQDLLDPFLAGKAIKGKFLSGKTIYLVPAMGQFHKWLPRQQAALRKLIDRRVALKRTGDWEIRNTLRAKAEMPTTTVDDFQKSLASENVIRMEGALIALPLLDPAGAGVEILASHLDSDRARIAMYALPRSLKELSSASRLEMLKKLVSARKVTVRKEAVRLLGLYASGESIDLLAGLTAVPDQHRDVKIAIGHAARESLHHEKAWELIERLSEDESPDIAISLLNADASAMNDEQRKRYVQVLLQFAKSRDAEVRAAFFSNSLQWQHYLPVPFAASACECLLKVKKTPEWQGAVRSLRESCRSSNADGAELSALVLETVLKLAAATNDPNAQKNRDCPSLQRLAVLTSELLSMPVSDRMRIQSALSRAGEKLIEDPRTRVSGVGFLLGSYNWKAKDAKEQMVAICEKVQHYRLAMDGLLDLIAPSLHGADFDIDDRDMVALIETLTSEPLPLARMVALAMLRAIGSQRKWNVHRRELLKKLRADEDTGVQEYAYHFFTVQES